MREHGRIGLRLGGGGKWHTTQLDLRETRDSERGKIWLRRFIERHLDLASSHTRTNPTLMTVPPPSSVSHPPDTSTALSQFTREPSTLVYKLRQPSIHHQQPQQLSLPITHFSTHPLSRYNHVFSCPRSHLRCDRYANHFLSFWRNHRSH